MGAVLALASAVVPAVGVPKASHAFPDNLDRSFDGDGRVLHTFDTESFHGRGLALQADGKLVMTGRSTRNFMDDFVITRYLNDGTPDPDFGGGDGVVTVNVGTLELSGRVDITKLSWDEAAAVAVDAGTGRILVLGSASRSFSRSNFALVALLPDGTVDTSFGDNGRVLTDFGGGDDYGEAITLLPDGKILAVGRGAVAGFVFAGFAAARYLPTGELDPTFGAPGATTVGHFAFSGKVVTDMGSLSSAHDVALSPIGDEMRLVLAGRGGNPAQPALVRYTYDGGLDRTFGARGRAFLPLPAGAGGIAHGVAAQADGKTVVAGRTFADGDLEGATVARFTADGRLDESFATKGVWISGQTEGLLDVALQRDGRIVAAGRASNSEFLLVRLTAQGKPDESFGLRGRVETGFAGGAVAEAIVLQPDCRIVAAGSARGFALARYLPHNTC